MVAVQIILISSLAICSAAVNAQVEHNFKMAPEKTDCHAIPDKIDSLSLEEVVNIIQSATYRLQEHISISRYRAPREATFYSCDGDKGWVIAKVDDQNFTVYADLPKSVWDSFINSEDPITFYNSTDFQKHLIKR
jgi:hypothetical protein